MLLLITANENYGDYKTILSEMKSNNLESIEILKTEYCFQEVEGYRKLTIKDIEKLADLTELEKINYQCKVARMLKNNN